MYFKRFIEVLTESEIIINEANLERMSIHPYQIISDKDNILHEASVLKGKAALAFNKAVEVFIELSKKFQAVAFELKKRNREWFESASKFDLNRVDLRDFKHEMYDYKTGVSRIANTPLPIFASINVEDFSGCSSTFKQTAFKEIFVKVEGLEEDINKNYFRGSNEKIEIKEHEIRALYSFALDWLKRYDQIVRLIASDNEKLNSILKSVQSSNTVSVNESTVLYESIFKDEYYDILIEDALDPKDIESEEKNKNNIETNNISAAETKEKNTTLEAVQKYWKICSTIQTMKMDACKEAYTAFTNLIDKVMDSKTRK